MKKVAIVGGGAAGLMAAVGVLEKEAVPVIFEKNRRLGLKLLITGKGRCNLTNDLEIPEFVENFPGNGTFLYSSLYNFSNHQLLDFFAELNVPTKMERGGRFFPESDKAGDVVGALTDYIVKKGAQIKYNTRVEQLWLEKGKLQGIKAGGNFYRFTSVIIAAGGLSYPKTGSTGDGYKLAREAGHTIVDPFPSLVPLKTKEKWVAQVQGLTLKNVQVTAFWHDKELGSEFGEMLFTHFGVSGPIILSLSRTIVQTLKTKGGPIKIRINLKPALDFAQLDARLQRVFSEFSKKQYKNTLDSLFPKSLIEPIILLSGIDPHKPAHQISKEERSRLANLIQSLELTIIGFSSYDEAIVTAGGVSVKEVDPSTMESKILKGLFFAGETLDIDGYTGGYNLQAAFSTGYLAGQSAGEYTGAHMHNI
ncbi:NAD(P)/FAD-dependent oxidoreductase [Desulfitibacter alkalitolerans]|uniref:NAD(P)/FAD-dependent oxidoreductase n=1 Tax=Desulfitibacter alkalitolerans TaxID=264641 RepID=UPI000485509E|nr:NAD(P)/FAD-dependent oxidoreductase [Desulfitibacter alkalitolerans]